MEIAHQPMSLPRQRDFQRKTRGRQTGYQQTQQSPTPNLFERRPTRHPKPDRGQWPCGCVHEASAKGVALAGRTSFHAGYGVEVNGCFGPPAWVEVKKVDQPPPVAVLLVEKPKALRSFKEMGEPRSIWDLWVVALLPKMSTNERWVGRLDVGEGDQTACPNQRLCVDGVTALKTIRPWPESPVWCAGDQIRSKIRPDAKKQVGGRILKRTLYVAFAMTKACEDAAVLRRLVKGRVIKRRSLTEVRQQADEGRRSARVQRRGEGVVLQISMGPCLRRMRTHEGSSYWSRASANASRTDPTRWAGANTWASWAKP